MAFRLQTCMLQQRFTTELSNMSGEFFSRALLWLALYFWLAELTLQAPMGTLYLWVHLLRCKNCLLSAAPAHYEPYLKDGPDGLAVFTASSSRVSWKKTLKIEPFKPSSSRSQYSNVPLSKQIKLLDKAIKIKSISIQCRLEVFSL